MDFDIVIAGGGPSGLSIASELSKKYKVAVIERGKFGVTTKSWLSYYDRITKLGFPTSVVSHRFKKWHFDYKDQSFAITDKFAVLDEKRVLAHWIEMCRSQGVELFERESYKSHRRLKEGIIVNGKFKCKLFVDCMGVHSPLLQKKIKNINYMNCIGAYVKADIKERNFFAFAEKHNGLWWSWGMTKLSPKRYFILLFTSSENKLSLRRYLPKFHEYAQKQFGSYKVEEYKIDHYATGKVKRHSTNNYLCFGDAGLFCPGFIGMGFNEILRQHKSIAKHLEICLRDNALDVHSLTIPVPIQEDAHSLVFSTISHIINPLDSRAMSAIFNKMLVLSNGTLKRLFRNTLNDDDILKIINVFVSSPNISYVVSKVPKKFLKPFILKYLNLVKT